MKYYILILVILGLWLGYMYSRKNQKTDEGYTYQSADGKTFCSSLTPNSSYDDCVREINGLPNLVDGSIVSIQTDWQKKWISQGFACDGDTCTKSFEGSYNGDLRADGDSSVRVDYDKITVTRSQ